MSLYPSIRVEGGLLGPDVLDQLLAAELSGQRAADFGLGARRNLTDEIASAFADARALWGVFQHRLEKVSPDNVATSVTRDAWVVPLLGLLGYELRFNTKAHDIDGQSFAISHKAGEPDDSPPVHIVGARQELGRVPASGRPRLSPHSLLQEYLNRTENLWGVVTNGLTLRLLRDCTFVRRQAYIEFDLPAILDEQRFQDFAALYRLVHRSRLPRATDDAESCFLEKYYAHSVQQGGRVREHLRDGVEQCLTMLANGFLGHQLNDDLRLRASPACVDDDRISAEELYRQFLILVYRFLFLLVSEDRGVLSASPIYREHYGAARLRRLLDDRAAFTEHDDLWQSLRVLWLILASDQPQPPFSNQPMASALGLPVLNGDLFAVQSLDGFTISNRDLLDAFWRLTWYQESATATPRRVNYAALDVEELGSVYESLLEFHPAVDLDHAGRPVFSFISGSERKTTGSYYTPPELVSELIKSALDPVIADRLAACSSEESKKNALLSIRVCDPACGSGHFLLAAARRLGRELARVQTGEDEPAPDRVREAVRDIVAHCIFGVDKNPLAVDLCRVALWLESHAAEKPLTFLDHRIRCGDSLVGVVDLAVLERGIPDKAFEPLEGDDKAYARELARRNKDERSGGRSLFDERRELDVVDLASKSRAIDAIPDDSPEAIRRKKEHYQRRRADPEWQRAKKACDLWAGAFFQPLRADQPGITSAVLAEQLTGRPAYPREIALAGAISARQRFFHWPLEFPEVFADGGFDVLLSNPPWERVKLQEQEFFAARDARIATAPTKAARGRLIRELPDTNLELRQEFVLALRSSSGASAFMRQSGRFPLSGRGDINTYAVFAELASSTTKPSGRAGLVLPKGIATDDTTKVFFGSLINAGRLIQLIGFENEEFIFPAVDHRVTFCTITIGGGARPETHSRIAFSIRRFSQLNDAHRFFSLEKSDFWLLNPNTGNCPIFRTQADAELTKAIYRRVPILWREAGENTAESNPWRITFKTLFHMSNDSHHFRTVVELEADGFRLDGNVFSNPDDRYLPLYEAKMLHHFDHRFSTYEGASEKQLNVGILPQPTAEQKRDPEFVVQPRYWVREEVVESAIPKYPEPLALALDTGDPVAIRKVLIWWTAGYHLNRGHEKEGTKLVLAAQQLETSRSGGLLFAEADPVTRFRELERDFSLTAQDVKSIGENLESPENVARELVARFSPKWFLGWRDICRATDARTMIASAVPRVPVGHTFPLLFSAGADPRLRLALVAHMNTLATDYATRQKVGGTHITYNLLKQFPVLAPSAFDRPAPFATGEPFLAWTLSRALELIYTATDLTELARDCDCGGPPFTWDEDRRFAIRCELDAAFFHLYLTPDANGQWNLVDGETSDQLTALQRHFPTPRAAVGYIMDQFPIVRQKDEAAHGVFRTRDRILEVYDAMLSAQRSGKPFQTSLNPPPGVASTKPKA
jgi:hypothetical protein